MTASANLMAPEHVSFVHGPILKVVRLTAAGVVGLVGLSILVGWVFNVPFLKGGFVAGITAKTNTGLAFVLCSIALGLLGNTRTEGQRATLARALSIIIFFIGFLTLCEHIFHVNVGIDQLLFREPPGELATTSPNRMGVPASTCFTLAAVAMFLLSISTETDTKIRNWAFWIALAMALVVMYPTLGYVLGAREVFLSARYTAIAFPTAVSLLVLSVGIGAACVGGRMIALLVADHAGGTLLRRLLIPILLLPPALGYLRSAGETSGLIDAAYARPLASLSIIVIFMILVWRIARQLEGTEQIRRGAEEAQSRLGAIVESSDDAIVSKTLNGIIKSWNQGAERIFGYMAEEAIGKSILLIVPPERYGEEANIISRIRSGERVDHFETVRLTKSGKRINLSVTISPIKDSRGRIIGASKVARDITKTKLVEEERESLLQAERVARGEAERVNRMKDEFLATLSHELRTPLNAIVGWSQLLRRVPKEDKDFEQGLEAIERNSRMQTQLIEDLLDMSRIVSGKLRLEVQRVMPPTFIKAALETVRPAAQAKGVNLDAVLDPHAGPISGDPNRLQQVIWNLLSNAIKFTHRGGKVQVVLQRVNSHIEISIADTGQGISEAFLPYIFDRFRQADASTTRKSGGLGLGLAIVKQLIELHGGTVQAKSAGEGHGSTFIVQLPLVVANYDSGNGHRVHPRTPNTELSEFSQADLSGVKVLVVDDEPDARALLQRVLNECHAEVTTAGSAAEGLTMVKSSKPDVLISDIGMPEVDGYEFLRQVRALGPSIGGRIPAIALTAFARSEDRTRALMAGYLVHVSKPVEPSELLATVASLVGRTG